METEDAFDKIMAKHHKEEVAVESEDDSDYGGSEEGGDPITTFRMLLENGTIADYEFIDRCQLGGLISQNPTCRQCSSPQVLVEEPQMLDGVQWHCTSCSSQCSPRDGSWFSDMDNCRLKDLLLILYCWSRNYSETDCQHELEFADSQTVTLIYKKCQKMLSDYFNNEICSIGLCDEIIDLNIFVTPSKRFVIGGVERNNSKNVFFTLLPENMKRDDLVTSIINNVAFGSTLGFQNNTILGIMGQEGREYLEKVWHFSLKIESKQAVSLIESHWSLIEKKFQDRVFTEVGLQEYSFRQRMERSRDPFLFLLSVISNVYPVS